MQKTGRFKCKLDTVGFFGLGQEPSKDRRALCLKERGAELRKQRTIHVPPCFERFVNR
jgi:hypothetical protein